MNSLCALNFDKYISFSINTYTQWSIVKQPFCFRALATHCDLQTLEP